MSQEILMTQGVDVGRGPALWLRPLAGPPMDAIRVEAGEPTLIGRGSSSDVSLDHPTVSRRHAILSCHSNRWTLVDLESTHGTQVNGTPIAPNEPVPLQDGDHVRVPPWTFLVKIGDRAVGASTLDDAGGRNRIEQVEVRSPAAREALAFLLSCAGAIHSADDEKALVDAVLDGLAHTGAERYAVLRQLGSVEEVDVLGAGPHGLQTFDERVRFSRSLLRGASQGQMVRLVVDDMPDVPQTIIDMGISNALCAPVMLDNAVWGFLYLDCQGASGALSEEASLLVQSLSQIASLALAKLRRAEVQIRLGALQNEVNMAAEIQEMISPALEGVVGPLRYASRRHIGRMVSGDVFDIVGIDEQRTSIVLGDVVGKGVGAGLLMVLTQTFLNSRLHSGDDPADAVSALNRHLHDRTGLQQFVSMWVGVVDAAARRVTYVDAGHGYAMMLAPGAEPETLSKNKGMVLGVERNIEFTSSTCEMPAGSRIVVYSDGVIEQPGDAGGRFGQERVMSHLSPSGDPAEDVESVALALAAFAGGRVYADDVTIVSAVIAADSSGTG